MKVLNVSSPLCAEVAMTGRVRFHVHQSNLTGCPIGERGPHGSDRGAAMVTNARCCTLPSPHTTTETAAQCAHPPQGYYEGRVK